MRTTLAVVAVMTMCSACAGRVVYERALPKRIDVQRTVEEAASEVAIDRTRPDIVEVRVFHVTDVALERKVVYQTWELRTQWTAKHLHWEILEIPLGVAFLPITPMLAAVGFFNLPPTTDLVFDEGSIISSFILGGINPFQPLLAGETVRDPNSDKELFFSAPATTTFDVRLPVASTEVRWKVLDEGGNLVSEGSNPSDRFGRVRITGLPAEPLRIEASAGDARTTARLLPYERKPKEAPERRPDREPSGPLTAQAGVDRALVAAINTRNNNLPAGRHGQRAASHILSWANARIGSDRLARKTQSISSELAARLFAGRTTATDDGVSAVVKAEDQEVKAVIEDERKASFALGGAFGWVPTSVVGNPEITGGSLFGVSSFTAMADLLWWSARDSAWFGLRLAGNFSNGPQEGESVRGLDVGFLMRTGSYPNVLRLTAGGGVGYLEHNNTPGEGPGIVSGSGYAVGPKVYLGLGSAAASKPAEIVVSLDLLVGLMWGPVELQVENGPFVETKDDGTGQFTIAGVALTVGGFAFFE